MKGAERVVTRTACLRRALSGRLGGRKLMSAVNWMMGDLESNLTGPKSGRSGKELVGDGVEASWTASRRVKWAPGKCSANCCIRDWEWRVASHV